MRKRFVFIFEILLLALGLYFYFYNEVVHQKLVSNHLLKVAIEFLLFLLILRFISGIVQVLYNSKKKLGRVGRDNFLSGINNISNLLIGLGLVLTLFKAFGIEIRTLLTSLSIVAAAIAIISKDYVNDFLAGLYFSFSNYIEINDLVQIGDIRGRVVELEMLKIKIINDNEDLVILPNTKVYLSEIINFTKRDKKSMSIDFQLDVRFVTNIETLEIELRDTLKEFDNYIESGSINLKIIEIKKDHIDFIFMYSLKSLDNDIIKSIRKKINRKVYNLISSLSNNETSDDAKKS